MFHWPWVVHFSKKGAKSHFSRVAPILKKYVIVIYIVKNDIGMIKKCYTENAKKYLKITNGHVFQRIISFEAAITFNSYI
jgi:hypothetical protein